MCGTATSQSPHLDKAPQAYLALRSPANAGLQLIKPRAKLSHKLLTRLVALRLGSRVHLGGEDEPSQRAQTGRHVDSSGADEERRKHEAVSASVA